MPPSLEQQQDRQARWRLAILRHAEEISGNVAQTCRYYGISRTRFYIWQRRYQEEGQIGTDGGVGREEDRCDEGEAQPQGVEAEVLADRFAHTEDGVVTQGKRGLVRHDFFLVAGSQVAHVIIMSKSRASDSFQPKMAPRWSQSWRIAPFPKP